MFRKLPRILHGVAGLQILGIESGKVLNSIFDGEKPETKSLLEVDDSSCAKSGLEIAGHHTTMGYLMSHSMPMVSRTDK